MNWWYCGVVLDTAAGTLRWKTFKGAFVAGGFRDHVASLLAPEGKPCPPSS
jgi:hypothetical protein